MKILFVDDDPKERKSLEETFQSIRHEWILEFAESGPKALWAMSKEPFDVVVADLRMPGMSGAQFLTHVMQDSPRTTRIILSDPEDRELVLSTLGTAHQFQSKPLDLYTLRSTLERTESLRGLIHTQRLKQIVSQMDRLPSLPSLYLEVASELQSPNGSLRRAGEIIAQDIGMTARILQLVNSAFFGLRRLVTTPADAAVLLGSEILHSMVLSANAFSKFETPRMREFSLDELWRHSSSTAGIARKIAEMKLADKAVVADAYMAGLLHDIGKLVLASKLPEQYRQVLVAATRDHVPSTKAEFDILGCTHAEVGAYLLGLWGVPDAIVEAVALHHRPGDSSENSFTPLTAVHVADALEHESRAGARKEQAARADEEYLDALGLADRLPIWREACAPAAART